MALKVSPKLLRRSLGAIAIALALLGIGLIAYPFATDLWAASKQRGLSNDLEGNARAYAAGEIRTGEALTRLEIPKLGVDVIVVEGTSLSALRAGAGHYPDSPLPGEPGNVAIAGHRTTFGRPFNRMHELMPGDRIVLTTPLARHTYQVVSEPDVTEPWDWSIIDNHPKQGSWLTLTSCHPEGSADERIYVHARLLRSVERSTAEAAA